MVAEPTTQPPNFTRVGSLSWKFWSHPRADGTSPKSEAGPGLNKLKDQHDIGAEEGCQRVHFILDNSSSVSMLPAALKAGASPPIPLALSCHWDGGGVGTIEHVSKG